MMRKKYTSYFRYSILISGIAVCISLTTTGCISDTNTTDQPNIHKENNSFGDTPLHIAVQNGDLETVNQLCLAPGINVNASNKYGISPIHYAAEKGDLQIVKALLFHQDLNLNKKNSFGKTALDLALQSGHEEVVDLLLKHGAISSNRINK